MAPGASGRPGLRFDAAFDDAEAVEKLDRFAGKVEQSERGVGHFQDRLRELGRDRSVPEFTSRSDVEFDRFARRVEDTEHRVDELRHGLASLSDRPYDIKIDTQSIDEALVKVRVLKSELDRLRGSAGGSSGGGGTMMPFSGYGGGGYDGGYGGVPGGAFGPDAFAMPGGMFGAAMAGMLPLLGGLLPIGAGLLGTMGAGLGAMGIGYGAMIPAYAAGMLTMGLARLGGGGIFSGATTALGSYEQMRLLPMRQEQERALAEQQLGLTQGQQLNQIAYQYGTQSIQYQRAREMQPVEALEARARERLQQSQQREQIQNELKLLHPAQRAAGEGLYNLVQAREHTFTEGFRGRQTAGAINSAFGTAQHTLMPLAASQWDKMFPVLDQGLGRLERFLGTPSFSRELERWTSGLPALLRDMMNLGAAGGQVAGGLVHDFTPLTQLLAGAGSSHLRSLGQWLNSPAGYDRIQQLGQSALPILSAGLHDVSIAGHGVAELLTGASGAELASGLRDVGEHLPHMIEAMNNGATRLPAFAHALGDVARNLYSIVGGTGSGPLMLLLRGMGGLANLAGGATGALNSLVPGMGSGLLSALPAALYARQAFGQLGGGAAAPAAAAAAASMVPAFVTGAGAEGPLVASSAEKATAGGIKGGLKGLLGGAAGFAAAPFTSLGELASGGALSAADGGALGLLADAAGFLDPLALPLLFGGGILLSNVLAGGSPTPQEAFTGTMNPSQMREYLQRGRPLGALSANQQLQALSQMAARGSGYINVAGRRVRSAAEYAQESTAGGGIVNEALHLLGLGPQAGGTVIPAHREYVGLPVNREEVGKINSQWREQAVTLRGLLGQYHQLTGELRRQREIGAETKAVLEQQKGTVEQIAQIAPSTAVYNPITGKLDHLDQHKLQQRALGPGAAHGGILGAAEGYLSMQAGVANERSAAAGVIHALGAVHGRGMRLRLLSEAEEAMASGKPAQLAAIAAQASHLGAGQSVAQAAHQWGNAYQAAGDVPLSTLEGQLNAAYGALHEAHGSTGEREHAIRLLVGSNNKWARQAGRQMAKEYAEGIHGGAHEVEAAYRAMGLGPHGHPRHHLHFGRTLTHMLAPLHGLLGGGSSHGSGLGGAVAAEVSSPENRRAAKHAGEQIAASVHDGVESEGALKQAQEASSRVTGALTGPWGDQAAKRGAWNDGFNLVWSFSEGAQSAVNGSVGKQLDKAFFDLGFKAAFSVAYGAKTAAGHSAHNASLTEWSGVGKGPGAAGLHAMFPHGGYSLSRTDAGVDFGLAGGHPLGAIAAGRIASVHQYEGFGTTIFEKLNHPIAGHHYIYYALEGGGTYNGRTGAVRAGTPIATGTGGGMEIGLASSPTVTGINQHHIAAGDRTRAGEAFARALGLNPGAPNSNTTVARHAAAHTATAAAVHVHIHGNVHIASRAQLDEFAGHLARRLRHAMRNVAHHPDTAMQIGAAK